MSAPEMREVRPLFDTPASVGAFVQPGAGQVAEVTERTALLTKKEHDLLDVPTRPKAVHFRNMEERDFWILFLTIIFGNIVAFFDSTLMYVSVYLHADESQTTGRTARELWMTARYLPNCVCMLINVTGRALIQSSHHTSILRTPRHGCQPVSSSPLPSLSRCTVEYRTPSGVGRCSCSRNACSSLQR